MRSWPRQADKAKLDTWVTTVEGHARQADASTDPDIEIGDNADTVN